MQNLVHRPSRSKARRLTRSGWDRPATSVFITRLAVPGAFERRLDHMLQSSENWHFLPGHSCCRIFLRFRSPGAHNPVAAAHIGPRKSRRGAPLFRPASPARRRCRTRRPRRHVRSSTCGQFSRSHEFLRLRQPRERFGHFVTVKTEHEISKL